MRTLLSIYYHISQTTYKNWFFESSFLNNFEFNLQHMWSWHTKYHNMSNSLHMTWIDKWIQNTYEDWEARVFIRTHIYDLTVRWNSLILDEWLLLIHKFGNLDSSNSKNIKLTFLFCPKHVQALSFLLRTENPCLNAIFETDYRQPQVVL